MKNKYRIVEIKKGKNVEYYIQIKRWWLPFWYTVLLGEHDSLDRAKDRLEYLKLPTIKTVIMKD
jgi:hypothetical protein